MTAQYWGLPDPDTDPALYEDVPTKRLFAWVVDVIIIALLTAIVVPFTLFTAFFFLPVLYAVISFLYRWVSLSRSSATPDRSTSISGAATLKLSIGMRL